MRWFKQYIWLKVKIQQIAVVVSIYQSVLQNITYNFFFSWPPVDFMDVISSLVFA